MSKSESIPRLLNSFTEKWSPRLVAAVNDHHVKVAKLDGEFIWHAHPNSDELFYLIAGKLTIELEGLDDVVMQVGDMFVIPRGIRHRPVAEEASVMLIEHESTINTGDEVGSERTKQAKDARGQY